MGDSVHKPQIGAKTETWLENSWRRSDNIVGDLEENYAITFHGMGTGISYGGTSAAVHSLWSVEPETAVGCFPTF